MGIQASGCAGYENIWLSDFVTNSSAFAALHLCCVSGPGVSTVAVITGSKQCCVEFMYWTAELNGHVQGNESPENEVYNFQESTTSSPKTEPWNGCEGDIIASHKRMTFHL